MNPEDVIIPEVLEEGTAEEITDRARDICQLLQDLDPFITALAETFQLASEEDKPAALNAFLALDAKRIEACDVFATQLAFMRANGIANGSC